MNSQLQDGILAAAACLTSFQNCFY